MFQTLKNAWKTQELRTKLLFTLLIVILYRLGSAIPVPFVSGVSETINNNSANYALTMIAGQSFEQATLFALGVSPYITSSIIVQLLTFAIPALERWAKEGEEGKKKIDLMTRIITLVLSVITSFGYAGLVISNGWTNITLNGTSKVVFINVFQSANLAGLKFAIMVACYIAGAMLVMWLAEKINDHGIGNGISVILFANIIARLPQTFMSIYNGIADSIARLNSTNYDKIPVGLSEDKLFYINTDPDRILYFVSNIVWAVIVVALLIGLTWLIVWFTDSERRIPVQYAKKVVGRKMYGGASSNLPLKLNMAGVMPVIFANSIVSIPGTLATIFAAGWLTNLANYYFAYTKPLYVVLSIILLFAFAYFYIFMSFNPTEVSNNIRNNGGVVPGIRPGKPTRDYIKKILHRVTLIGAIFLCIVSEVPKIIVSIFATINDLNTVFAGFATGVVKFYTYGANLFMTVAFSGTSMLIVVGVVLEIVRELEAQLTMRNMKGFLD
ncbi:MAG: preprotein translocase subunit SecY [Ruminococcaceae bacterium]|nr:preprotein translocase subunit SecY [Oscillospiraceae bacterium]